MSGSSVADSRNLIIDGCRMAEERNMKDILFNDVDGSFDPAQASTGGALISNMGSGVFDSGCNDVGNCMAYCPGMCLRTMYFRVEQFGTEGWTLTVCIIFTSCMFDTIIFVCQLTP